MYPDTSRMMHLLLSFALIASSQAFFYPWSSDSSSQSTSQKTWVQPIQPIYRYPHYNPYESHKVYQYQQNAIPQQQYHQPEIAPVQQNLTPIPISVPAGSSLTPVSLQHVQLVPCMCPVAPEEAEKFQEQVGPGPYLAQTYSQSSYTVPQQVMTSDNSQIPTKQ